jgi:hypothetical protein
MRLRLIVATSLMLTTGEAPPARSADPATPPTRSFSHITGAILACMVERSRKRHGTVYTSDPADPNRLTSETHYFGLTRIVSEFDPANGTVTYQILQKPGLASYDQIWNGLRDAIAACS